MSTNLSEDEKLLMNRAKSFAKSVHEEDLYGQLSHIFDDIYGDEPKLHAAAWLHSAVESNQVTLEQVWLTFGDELTQMVDTLSTTGSDCF